MRAIDEAVVGLRSEDKVRRLAIVRAQLAALAREIEKDGAKASPQALARIAAE
jgi:hypothetical protein